MTPQRTSRVMGALLAAVLLGTVTPLSAAEEIARIKMARGAAYVERAGAQQPATPGLALLREDVLVTGADGRMALTFADNSRFSIERNSRVALQRFEFDTTSHAGALEARIDAGSMAIVSGKIAKETPDAMKIITPTSVLGARGTRFIVEVPR